MAPGTDPAGTGTKERGHGHATGRALTLAAGSAVVLARGGLAALAGTRRGCYAQHYMPPFMQSPRLAGDAVMAVAAAPEIGPPPPWMH